MPQRRGDSPLTHRSLPLRETERGAALGSGSQGPPSRRVFARPLSRGHVEGSLCCPCGSAALRGSTLSGSRHSVLLPAGVLYWRQGTLRDTERRERRRAASEEQPESHNSARLVASLSAVGGWVGGAQGCQI
jgi:hypothetical protein